MSPARYGPSGGGKQLPARPRLHRPRGAEHAVGAGGRAPTARHSRPRQPRAPAGRFPSELTSTPLLPLPARPPQQHGGEQPPWSGRHAGTAPGSLPPHVRARCRGAGAGLTCRRAALPRGGSRSCPAGGPGEQPAPLTSLAASPAAGLAVAVIHAVQDDQGKGEETKLHPAPLGWAASSGGSEGRRGRRRAGRGGAGGGSGQRLPLGTAGVYTPLAALLGSCELTAASSISPALRGERGEKLGPGLS